MLLGLVLLALRGGHISRLPCKILRMFISTLRVCKMLHMFMSTSDFSIAPSRRTKSDGFDCLGRDAAWVARAARARACTLQAYGYCKSRFLGWTLAPHLFDPRSPRPRSLSLIQRTRINPVVARTVARSVSCHACHGTSF